MLTNPSANNLNCDGTDVCILDCVLKWYFWYWYL